MKVMHIGKLGNMERYSEKDSYLYQLEKVDLYMGLTVEQYLEAGGDADFIVTDAIGSVPGELIRRMPNLKLIHSEGVAYNKIDTEAAREQGVYVCNSQGMNASAVAEQTLLLILGMLRNVIGNDRAVRSGSQIRRKEAYMQRGDLKELADCSVGLIGFGDIARHTANLLRAHGVRTIYYYKRTPLSEAEERACGVSYLPMKDLLGKSDIVSLHLPVNENTAGMADDAFFSAMKQGSYFVNTARGELVNDRALAKALADGRLCMAGLDTVDREPVQRDHPLLNLPEELSRKILFSPHIGGITASSFRRSYAMIWEDVQAAAEGRMPQRIVNG